MQLGIDLMVETLKQWSLWQILLLSQLLSALLLATLFWGLSILLTYGGKVPHFLVYSLSQEVILWVKSPDQPPGNSNTQTKCVLLWPPWVWFRLSKTRCCFCSVLWPFAWRKVLGTAGVMSAVATPAPLGGNTPALVFISCLPCTSVGVKGQEPPSCRMLKWDPPSSKSLEVPGPIPSPVPAQRGWMLPLLCSVPCA